MGIGYSLITRWFFRVHPWSWEAYDEEVRIEVAESYGQMYAKIMTQHNFYRLNYRAPQSPWDMVREQTLHATDNNALEWLEVQSIILTRWNNEARQELAQGHAIVSNCPKTTPCICPSPVQVPKKSWM